MDTSSESTEGTAVDPRADSSYLETDSALGDDTISLTESLSTSVCSYRYENGRRYHAFQDGKYHLPNDDTEAERLDLQHHISLLELGGKLHRAPLSPSIQSALDVGTGTGIWAIDFADQYPSARVTGTDLSPIQPSWVPPNLTFLVDDIESDDDWFFQEPFDYIHSRFLILALRDWPRYFRRSFQNLRPGGWIEVMEGSFPFRCDDPNVPDPPTITWSKVVSEATSKLGVDAGGSVYFSDYLRQAGFVNVHEGTSRWPVGPWSKNKKEREIGKWMMANVTQGIEAAGMALLTRVLGWNLDDAQDFFEKVKADILNPDTHTYSNITVHYAQKPEEPAAAATADSTTATTDMETSAPAPAPAAPAPATLTAPAPATTVTTAASDPPPTLPSQST